MKRRQTEREIQIRMDEKKRKKRRQSQKKRKKRKSIECKIGEKKYQ